MDASRANGADEELTALRAAAALVAQGVSPRSVLETAAATWRMQLPLTSSRSGALTVGVGLRCSPRWAVREAEIIDLDHRLLDDDQHGPRSDAHAGGRA